MADLVIVTPSRGRAARLREMVEAVHSTAQGDVCVMVGLDLDDPTDYGHTMLGYDVGQVVVYRGERKSLSGWTNHFARQVLDGPNPPRYLASLGDDHLPRTPGWDRKLIEAIESLDGPGIAYGDDLYQRGHLCTAWIVSAEVVRALGWMMLPTCQHLYVDNAVMELGRAAGRIVYRPDVVIEHLHPVAGKTAWDASYRETNADDRYAADRAVFEAWRADGLAVDAATVRGLAGHG